jgi:putative heme-binding domain-containing protein
MAVDTDNPAPVRQAALRALASLKGERFVPALEQTLADADVEVRREAQALLTSRNLPDTTLAPLLETILTHGTVPEQQQALAALGNLKSPRAEALIGTWMDDLAAGTVPPELQLDVLMAAEQHTGGEVRDRYDRYVARRGSSDPIAEYRETLYGGDPAKGRTVVLRHPAAECMRCHALEEGGGQVGPALVGVGGRLSRVQLLEALVAPGVRLAPGFGTVTLTLRNGQTVAGTLQDETDSTLSLKLGTGETQDVAKQDIATRQNSPSAMPPMQNLLTPAEIRDAIAFLASLD